MEELAAVTEAINLNALSSTELVNTIRPKGYAKMKLSILLDSGSTHSFVDLETAKQIGYPIKEARPMRVTMANGNYIMSLYSCPKFQWKIHGEEFEDSVRLLTAGGCNMILGEDWMRNHNPVLLDFVAYEAQVSHLGRKVRLRGITENVIE